MHLDDSLFAEEASAPPPRPVETGVSARFYQRSVLDRIATEGGVRYVKNDKGVVEEVQVEAAGRPIHVLKDYVTILSPGDKRNIVDRPATPEDKKRFSAAWKAYKAGQGDAVVGTPLSAVPWLNRADVDDYAYFKVRTVEELAGVSDGVLGNLGIQARAHRTRAQDFLEAARGGAPSVALRAELDAKDREAAALRAKMEAMEAKLAEVLAAKADPTHDSVAAVREARGYDDEPAPAVTVKPTKGRK